MADDAMTPPESPRRRRGGLQDTAKEAVRLARLMGPDPDAQIARIDAFRGIDSKTLQRIGGGLTSKDTAAMARLAAAADTGIGRRLAETLGQVDSTGTRIESLRKSIERPPAGISATRIPRVPSAEVQALQAIRQSIGELRDQQRGEAELAGSTNEQLRSLVSTMIAYTEATTSRFESAERTERTNRRLAIVAIGVAVAGAIAEIASFVRQLLT
jgi:hypothetical protein